MAGKSIKQHLLTSWMISILVAVVGSAILSIGLSYLDYTHYRDSAESVLRDDARTIARRVAAELLLKENGRLDPVINTLKSEYQLDDIRVASAAQATPLSGTEIRVREEIPGVMPPTVAWVMKRGKPFAGFMNIRNFIFVLIPILTLALAGFLIQRRLLRRYIIRPIESLSETSIGARAVKSHWPTEIQTIANELSESFSAREQAIFGRIAQGLIHDIRTKIHSIGIAHQLVTETQPGSQERAARLEKLDSACDRNISKIRELIDLSLDGSREIVLKPRAANLSETIHQSIDGLRDLIDLKTVRVNTQLCEKGTFSHDPVQFERVLTNLLKNAIEAVEEKNTSERQIIVRSEAIPRGLKVIIEDNGAGFQDIKQVFRPFKTTKAHGYGLGLFVSRKIVESHGGKLVAENSETLGGAKFTITLKESEVSS